MGLSLYYRWRLLELKKVLKRVKKERANLVNKSDEDLKKIYSFLEPSEESLALCLALGSEAIKRKLNMNPYDEQIMCAAGMCLRNACEFKPGEGKTLAIGLAAIYRALFGNVTVVTVNDYLASRDCKKLSPAYDLLGLTSCYNPVNYDKDYETIFNTNIIYTSSHNLIFDYLNDELTNEIAKYVKFDTAILDEIDFILLDNANSEFAISTTKSAQPARVGAYILARDIVNLLRGKKMGAYDTTVSKDLIFDDNYDYVYNVSQKSCYLTDRGIAFIENYLNTFNITIEMPKVYYAVLDTIWADHFHKKGEDYLVEGRRIYLINRENGRIMENSQREFGKQTAIEIKEGLDLPKYMPTRDITMSYQIFFSKYKFLCGTSGTIQGAEQEFENIFDLCTVVIPEHCKNIRVDHKDIIVKTKVDAYIKMIEIVKHRHSKGQPLLLIGQTEQESQKIASLLREENLPFNLLNNNYSYIEDELLKSAGKKGAITVSTNMSGRGSDIITTSEANQVGGLFVICLGHFDSVRIDNQVRGRAGRQGNPGESLFIVSLEDSLFDNVIERVLNKYINTKDEKFNSNRVQRKIRQIIKYYQNVLDDKASKYRQLNFKMDSICELYRLYITRHEFIGDSYMNYIRDFVQKFPLEISFNLINDKIRELGEDISEKLLKEIFSFLIKENWGDCRLGLLDAKKEIEFMYTLDDKERYRRFIKISSEIRDSFIEYISEECIQYFVSAYKEG